jgi:hypothetical protein
MSDQIKDGGPYPNGDGGPAFPVANDSEKFYNCFKTGMTLRDYFAAKAMSDVMRQWRDTRDEDGSAFDIDCPLMAEDCYMMADAMIEARKKSP